MHTHLTLLLLCSPWLVRQHCSTSICMSCTGHQHTCQLQPASKYMASAFGCRLAQLTTHSSCTAHLLLHSQGYKRAHCVVIECSLHRSIPCLPHRSIKICNCYCAGIEGASLLLDWLCSKAQALCNSTAACWGCHLSDVLPTCMHSQNLSLGIGWVTQAKHLL